MNQPSTPIKFSLLDAMFLVGVTAVGLAWNRFSMKDFNTYNYPWNRISLNIKYFNYAMWVLVPHLALWSLAILAIGLLRGRHRFSELVRRPGLAACGAAALAIAFDAAWYVPFKIAHPNGILPGIAILRYVDTVSFAIAGAWLVLTAGALWEAEAHWHDRVGRALGVAWLLVTVAFHARDLIL
jgi:hypothetical protein